MSERRGYTMGRLLAALDHLGVVRDVEGLYVLASIDPRHLTGPLNRATAMGAAARDYLAPLLESLPADSNPFGAVLTDEEQSDFGLGYYHLRAEIRAKQERTLTVAHVAEELGISERRVRELAAERTLGTRLGARLLVFSAAEVEAMRERRPVGRPPQPTGEG